MALPKDTVGYALVSGTNDGKNLEGVIKNLDIKIQSHQPSTTLEKK
ncbi:hypothetical protein PCH70_27340 [Pseudomonas cichorii JBC1]|nr:hypothetical protein PCH70_27340 [Pseudomonas cichorii JBC1]